MEGIWWLFFNIIATVASGFYSMAEMACVSLNRARLHFSAMRLEKRALWLQTLLDKPSQLFGTTLIGVNVATFVGSECGREFYAYMGIHPDWAPLTQVPFVIIFGELAPMLAARHYPDQVAKQCAPLLYLSSKIAYPFVYLLTLLTDTIDRLTTGNKTNSGFYLSQEDLEQMISEQDRKGEESQRQQPFNRVVSSLFRLEQLKVEELMHPLSQLPLIEEGDDINVARMAMKKAGFFQILIYRGAKYNIIGQIEAVDLLSLNQDSQRLPQPRPLWYITTTSKIAELLHQFRHNHQKLAVVLNEEGNAVGAITFDEILKTLLGEKERC